MVHNPDYDLNNDNFAVGAAYWCCACRLGCWAWVSARMRP